MNMPCTGKKGSDLNAGKNLTFLGHNGQIDLENSVTQGAGSLTFTDDYTVTTSNGSTLDRGRYYCGQGCLRKLAG